MRTLLVAAAALALLPATANAAYFVNAVANLGSASDGGLVENGPTSASASVAGGAAQAKVDLATGQAKTYLSFYGPDVAGPDFGSLGAVFGDTVTFNGSGNAAFKFNVDGSIVSDPIQAGNPSTYQVFMFATLRVFAAGSGATPLNFTSTPGALVSKTFTLNIVNPTESLSQTINEQLFGSTAVVSGGSYDIFASFSSGVAMNGQPVHVELDFLHTATFGIDVDPGITFTSESGEFLTGGVPEPATWAMLILGFGGTGALLRRQKRLAVSI